MDSLGQMKRNPRMDLVNLLRTAQMNRTNNHFIPNLIFEAPSTSRETFSWVSEYRPNSWDAWTVEQFDQHFREQVLFAGQ